MPCDQLIPTAEPLSEILQHIQTDTMAEPAKEAPKPAEGEEKISPAELKKRAKAEKQARRAAQKGEGAPAGGPPTANGAPTGERS